MISKLFNFFFKEKTDLEITLNLLRASFMSNMADTDAVNDCVFYVGLNHTLRFSSKEIECALYFNSEEVPMFIFDEPTDVGAIREFVINKLDTHSVS